MIFKIAAAFLVLMAFIAVSLEIFATKEPSVLAIIGGIANGLIFLIYLVRRRKKEKQGENE